MPQVTRAKQQDTVAYGTVPNQNVMLFQERLMLLFKPHEYVTVMNVDDETFRWQYMPATSEEFEYTADPMKITRRGLPEIWEIAPGAQETIVGASAYIMIDGLYKKLTAKRKLAESPEITGQAINFSFADGGQQQKWINKIFIGKATPTFQSNNPSKDLGLDNATPKQTLTSPAPAKN